MLDSVSSRPCGITPAMLEEVASPKEFVTLSSKPTSKSKLAPRNYLHTPEQIAKELRVDEEGRLWWKQPRHGRVASKPVGSRGRGALFVTLDGKMYTAHAIAFCLYYARWPLSGLVIDHMNNNPFDNRKENLREVTNSINALNREKLPSNNTSGVMGVFWESHKQRWKATFWFNNKFISGGHYKNFEDAVAARRQLEIDYGVADYAVVTSCTSPKPKTLDSMSIFQNISL